MKYGEPWSIEDRGPEGMAIVWDAILSNTAECFSAERAQRIVATINACAGLDLPDDVPVGALAELVAACRTLGLEGTDAPIAAALAKLGVQS